MAQGSSTTKSIDVGGVFLMDLSMNDSDSSLPDHELLAAEQYRTHQFASASTTASTAIVGKHNQNHQQSRGLRAYDNTNVSHIYNQHNNDRHHQQQHHLYDHHQDKSIRLSPTSHHSTDDNRSSSSSSGGGGGGGKNSNNIKETATLYNNKRAAALQPGTQPPSSDHHLSMENSIDKLASVIYCDGRQKQKQEQQLEQQRDDERSLTIVDAQVAVDSREALSSLSDESYVPSSSTSLSASLTGSSAVETGELPYEEAEVEEKELEEEFGDRASTTTREDSGVLDMKDLEGQLSKDGSYEYDDGDDGTGRVGQPSANSKQGARRPVLPLSLERQEEQQQQQQERPQEKSISANIMATNLINKSANGNINFQYQQQANNNNYRSIIKPTDGNGGNQHANNHYNHNNYHHHHNNNNNNNNNNHRSNHHNSKRSISASLPIQVPARQMKRNLNRMKLNLMKEEEQEQQQQQQQVQLLHNSILEPKQQQRQLKQQAALEGLNSAESDEDDSEESPRSPVRKGDRNRPAFENIAAFCVDDDAFLEQEFNANHNNHYPNDELDDEHLTAEEDPMRLFASIQALAKSLHEDAELFGSLPPKRMLESPIRSLALV